MCIRDRRHYETMMAKVIEPMISISRFQGGYCDQELINYFWKIIFKNQFHDSIYGSSPDSINHTVENRLLNLRHGLNELIDVYKRQQLKLRSKQLVIKLMS